MMTNYPAEFAPSFWDYPLPIAIRIGWLALKTVTWDPRKWATQPSRCYDLPSAWWISCHSWEYCLEEHGMPSNLKKKYKQLEEEMQNHLLKTESKAFQAVKSGIKTAEFRLNDRDFAVGDILSLCEIDQDGIFTGDSISVRITHLQEGFGIPGGYVMLSFKPLG